MNGLTTTDIDRVVTIVCLYLPRAQARQMLCDLANARAAMNSKDMRAILLAAVDALDKKEAK